MPQYKIKLKDEQQKSPDVWLFTYQGDPTYHECEEIIFEAPDDLEANLYVESSEITSPPLQIKS